MDSSISNQTDLIKKRLLSLLDYGKAISELRKNNTTDMDNYKKHLLERERDLLGLDGIHFNQITESDTLWLSVERLQPIQPPQPNNQWLTPWLEVANDPDQKPTLKTAVQAEALIRSGTHQTSNIEGDNYIETSKDVILKDYPHANIIHEQLNHYLSKWQTWSNKEKPRRRSITLYSKLFQLYQDAKNSSLEQPIELQWGIGIGTWDIEQKNEKEKTLKLIKLNHPFITHAVELALNERTAACEIRPKDAMPKLELDWFAAQGSTYQTAEIVKKATQLFEQSDFNPFDENTYKEVLKTVVIHLDAEGEYISKNDACETPANSTHLRVNDTWAIFARPKNNQSYIADLQAFANKLAANDVIPPVLRQMLTEPSTEATEDKPLSNYRGLSMMNASHDGEQAADLYFPLAFNDEQVNIIQYLDNHSGVVVQGPPGTGKTHTIANVICHYLAHGKRILVTSMKEPALNVLRDKLPKEIQHLTVTLLLNEQDGKKQFEASISKIAAEVQSLDKAAVRQNIKRLEDAINHYHQELARTNREIKDWAIKNLNNITMDKQTQTPEEAARKIMDAQDMICVIPDVLNTNEKFNPKFTDVDMQHLRNARMQLQDDIAYIEIALPKEDSFPDDLAMGKLHQKLVHVKQMDAQILAGDMPLLKDDTTNAIHALESLHNQLLVWQNLTFELQSPDWVITVQNQLNVSNSAQLIQIFKQVGIDLTKAREAYSVFLEKPVSIPHKVANDPVIQGAIHNLAEGKKPFGIMGWFNKKNEHEQLSSIKVIGISPKTDQDWVHVKHWLDMREKMRILAVRWNASAHIVGVPTVNESFDGAYTQAFQIFELFKKIEEKITTQNLIHIALNDILAKPAAFNNFSNDTDVFERLKTVVEQHIHHIGLKTALTKSDQLRKILNTDNGRWGEDAQKFLDEMFGSAAYEESAIVARWSALLQELRRLLALTPLFKEVKRLTHLITQSGAPKYGQILNTIPVSHGIDKQLPSNWQECWNLSRMNGYLNNIQAQDKMKALSAARQIATKGLANAYQEIVAQKSWLKLSENATPSVKAALQAFMTAINRIGKGTGKNAHIHRKSAKDAANAAGIAIPCWIMPHYQVSENLPVQLGFFDLIIIDEASQSDFSALPAILRAKKVLVVGDDKQVSPEGVGMDSDKIQGIKKQYLDNQVSLYRDNMNPEKSIYDLFKVVFASSQMMLKEHFRCVSPIIEYSKREFYNHELQPLRLSKISERLAPPLIDVLIKGGFRKPKTDINLPEAQYIVDEIRKIIQDPKMQGRTIGVVTLLGNEQAKKIWDELYKEPSVGPEKIELHQIACGDARTFQGKERDIIFLSMVVAPNEGRITPVTREGFAQRFNVAASRARDRMYLVRSVELSDLSNTDTLRRGLINHFNAPFMQDEVEIKSERELCESGFEIEVYDALIERGYRVKPQVKVGRFRIDMVVEGENDARLAVECDGDAYHGADKWDDDARRQAILERAGWSFWRCFASTWVRQRNDKLNELIEQLAEKGIYPIQANDEKNNDNRFVAYREITATDLQKASAATTTT